MPDNGILDWKQPASTPDRYMMLAYKLQSGATTPLLELGEAEHAAIWCQRLLGWTRLSHSLSAILNRLMPSWLFITLA